MKIRWAIYIKKDGHILCLAQMIEIFHFLKVEKFINELGKTFSNWENGRNPLGIPPIPQNVWSKGPENMYF